MACPSSLKYVLNGMDGKGWKHNLFRDMYTDHSDEENRIIEKWADPKDCKGEDLLWGGCGVRIFPYGIEHSKALTGLQKFGGKSDCCGLYGSRSGLKDTGRYVVNNLIDKLSR